MAPMIEFAQTYGLWIALATVFVAMHWFGRGCCGGRVGQRQREEQGQGTEGVPDQGLKGEQASHTTSRSGGGSH
jgi:hypothetical protein